jgi:hypothetical protein
MSSAGVRTSAPSGIRRSVLPWPSSWTSIFISDGRFSEFQRSMRLAVERIESNPWTHELRAALGESERTGDTKLIDDFVLRFKEDERRRYPR